MLENSHSKIQEKTVLFCCIAKFSHYQVQSQVLVAIKKNNQQERLGEESDAGKRCVHNIYSLSCQTTNITNGLVLLTRNSVKGKGWTRSG